MRHLVRSREATWRRLPEAVVLALPGAEGPLRLNRTGALVWDVLAEATSETDLSMELAQTCGKKPDEVTAALETLLGELFALGAIEVPA